MLVRVRALHGTYGQYSGHSSGHLAGVPKGCVRHYHSWYSEQEQQNELEEARAEINTERDKVIERERGTEEYSNA